jgi:hypothetical protein
MMASELIAKFAALIAEHGDLPVYTYNRFEYLDNIEPKIDEIDVSDRMFDFDSGQIVKLTPGDKYIGL